MRKLLFIISILGFLFSVNQAQAQCTPGNYSNPGIYPDTSVNLPEGAAGQAYNAVVTFVVPYDTTIEISGVPQTVVIDSVGITDVRGMPSGFNFLPNSSTGYWPGDTSGCVLLTGNPTSADTGAYPLQIDTKISGGGFTIPVTVEGYEIVILDSTHVSIQEKKAVDGVAAYPNPFHGDLTINFDMNVNAPVEIGLYNMVGHEVKSKTINASKGSNKILFNTSELSQGVYFYRLNTGDKIITRKLVKK